MRARIGLVALWLTACGGDDNQTTDWASLENLCAAPRPGVDPATGSAYSDKQGTLADEERFLRAWIDDTYLWYSEVPNVDPASYSSAVAYFGALKTPATTASGKPKDQFHFTYATSYWESLAGSGVTAGYGADWAVINPRPPREVVVAYTQPDSPATAAAANLARGAEVVSVDGADVESGDADTLNAGLFPSDVGEMHTFTVKDVGTNSTRPITMTSAAVTDVPVQNVKTIDAGSGKVGYLLFNDHLSLAEKGLVDAITKLKSENITDLVVDIRYNGGGYLVIASELAYMVAGPTRTAGKTFELTVFNDKHPKVDPVAQTTIEPTLFTDKTYGFSEAPGQALPHLDLPRVFVLTSGGTCSASEAVMNGLAGVDVEVIQIGTTTCGKPYGFYDQGNCGTTYFSIQFKGENDKGFGDYADGFSPGPAASESVFRGCTVADDFTHELGDPNEARLAAALAFAQTGACPVTPSAAVRGGGVDLSAVDGQVWKNPWRQNRIRLK